MVIGETQVSLFQEMAIRLKQLRLRGDDLAHQRDAGGGFVGEDEGGAEEVIGFVEDGRVVRFGEEGADGLAGSEAIA